MPAVEQCRPNPQSLIPNPWHLQRRMRHVFPECSMRLPSDTTSSIISSARDSTSGGARRAVEALQLTGRETVLDLCTGTADLALAAMSGQRRARRVVGVDFSAAMLQIGNEKVRRRWPRGPRHQSGSRRCHAHPAARCVGRRDDDWLRHSQRRAARRGVPRNCASAASGRHARDSGIFTAALAGASQFLPLVFPKDSAAHRPRSSRSIPSAYTYLPESVEAFPSPEEFSQQLRDAGFGTVRAVPLTFGIVYMFVAVKGPRSDRVL